MKRLAWCHRRTTDASLDFEEQQCTVTTYNGLESYILNGCSYGNESASGGISGPDADGCTGTDSLDEDASSCSSSKDASGSSFSSQCLPSSKREEQLLGEWDALNRLHHLYIKGKKPMAYSIDVSDIEAIKEKFAKLLLGEDVSGGTKGISTAFALSHAITTLAASIFGELRKLEPLSEERKSRWHREMDWLLSPANYMVELVPAKQKGANGRIVEIMTPKARSDVHMTLPALRKLDSMLIEMLDSMVNSEFWYAETGSRGDGHNDNSGERLDKKWWIPYPRVPDSGLSPSQRGKLGFQVRFVHQILKAAKSINEQVLGQMPIPYAIKDALPRSWKASLGVDIFHAIAAESIPIEEILLSPNMETEHIVLDVVNRLEGAIFALKQKNSYDSVRRSPMRYPWSFVKENGSGVEKMALYLERTEALLRLVKMRFPNLPRSFIDVTKVQYNKDIGHSIVEAYSRVLVGLAFSILTRIGDILQEDDLKKPTTPIANLKFDFSSNVYLAGITDTPWSYQALYDRSDE